MNLCTNSVNLVHPKPFMAPFWFSFTRRCFSHTKLIFCCHFRYILVEFILSHLCNFFAYSYHPCVSQTCDQTVPFFGEHNILNRKSRGWDCEGVLFPLLCCLPSLPITFAPPQYRAPSRKWTPGRRLVFCLFNPTFCDVSQSGVSFVLHSRSDCVTLYVHFIKPCGVSVFNSLKRISFLNLC